MTYINNSAINFKAGISEMCRLFSPAYDCAEKNTTRFLFQSIQGRDRLFFPSRAHGDPHLLL